MSANSWYTVTPATASADYTKGLGTLTYNNGGDVDLMYNALMVESKESKESKNPVEFNFQHLLSKVRVSFVNAVDPSINMEVSDVEIRALKSSSYNTTSGTWNVSNESDNFNADIFETYRYGNISYQKDANNIEKTHLEPSETGSTDCLFFIPANKYKITFKITLKMNNVSEVLYTGPMSATITAAGLEKGNAYNFTTSITNGVITGNEEVLFEIEHLKGWYGDELMTGENYYDTFGELSKLLVAAKFGGEVTLTDNLTISSTIDVLDDLTINLNGKTITYTSEEGPLFYVVNRNYQTNSDDVLTTLTINGNDNDNSKIISNSVSGIASAINGGNIHINSGTYEAVNSADILDVVEDGEIIVTKGLFRNWNPAKTTVNHNFVDNKSRSVKTTVNDYVYYKVDKIIPFQEITTESSNPVTDIKTALQNPFLDKLIIDDECEINNTGKRLDINHDIVIEGSSLTTDINTGGTTGSNYVYGFAVLGPYNVTFNNLIINGGGIAGSGATIYINNCTIITKYKKNGGNCIYIANGYIEVSDSKLTILAKDDKNTYNANNNYFGADKNGTIVAKGNMECSGSGKEGFAVITSTNPEVDKSGEIIIYGGIYDKDPSSWVPSGYTATKSGSTWTVGPIASEQ